MNKSNAEIQRQKNIDSVKMEIFYKNRNEPYIVEVHPREAGFDLFYLRLGFL